MDILASTVLAQQLQKHMGLDNMNYSLLYSGVVEAVAVAKKHIFEQSFELELNYMTGSVLVFCLLSFLVHKFYKKHGTLRFWKSWMEGRLSKGVSELELYDEDKIDYLRKYIQKYPQYFSKTDRMISGDPEIISIMLGKKIRGEYRYGDDDEDILDMCNLFKDGTKHKVTDTQFDITGELQWTVYTVEITLGDKKENQQVKEIDRNSVCLRMDTDRIGDISEYLEKIEKQIDEDDDGETFYHCKYFIEDSQMQESRKIIYEGPRQDKEVLKTTYMDSFFHPQKEELWKVAQIVSSDSGAFIDHGQSPQMGLLLYGPPGTGKSSFAYRLARALKRHIISVDVREFESRQDIYSIFRSPYIYHNAYKPEDIVYILDEFDLAVEFLNVKKKVKKFSMLSFKSKVSKFSMGPALPETDSESDEDNEEEGSGEGEGQQSGKKKKKKLKNVVEDDDYCNSMSNKDFQIEDLLELINGPVPNTGAIIIATTNDYEKIREACPALVRAGRLTPTYFGYFDVATFQKLVNYYYDRDFDEELPDPINITNSQVIEIAVRSKILYSDDKEGSYNYFKNKIMELL